MRLSYDDTADLLDQLAAKRFDCERNGILLSSDGATIRNSKARVLQTPRGAVACRAIRQRRCREAGSL